MVSGDAVLSSASRHSVGRASVATFRPSLVLRTLHGGSGRQVPGPHRQRDRSANTWMVTFGGGGARRDHRSGSWSGCSCSASGRAATCLVDLPGRTDHPARPVRPIWPGSGLSPRETGRALFPLPLVPLSGPSRMPHHARPSVRRGGPPSDRHSGPDRAPISRAHSAGCRRPDIYGFDSWDPTFRASDLGPDIPDLECPHRPLLTAHPLGSQEVTDPRRSCPSSPRTR